MIVRASLLSLLRRRSRTALALAGIGISAALLLDMTLLASGLSNSFGKLMASTGYTLRVTPRGILPFDSDATLADAAATERTIRALSGVREVAPVLGAQFRQVRGDSVGEPMFTTGIRPDAQMLFRLVAGRPPGNGEVVVSAPLARAEGLRPGSGIRLTSDTDVGLARAGAARAYRVSGVADFLYDYAGQRSLAMPLAEVQVLTGRADQASLFGVMLTPGADPDSVAARIARAVPAASAYSLGELLAETDRRLLYFRQLAAILGSVALVVTALLVATIVTIGVRERWGEIATLRALGVGRRRILGGVVAEGLALATVGCALGLPFGLWMAGRLDRILLSFPGLPANVTFFEWNTTRVGAALATILAVGALSGCIPGVQALRVPLGRALREEAE